MDARPRGVGAAAAPLRVVKQRLRVLEEVADLRAQQVEHVEPRANATWSTLLAAAALVDDDALAGVAGAVEEEDPTCSRPAAGPAAAPARARPSRRGTARRLYRRRRVVLPLAGAGPPTSARAALPEPTATASSTAPRRRSRAAALRAFQPPHGRLAGPQVARWSRGGAPVLSFGACIVGWRAALELGAASAVMLDSTRRVRIASIPSLRYHCSHFAGCPPAIVPRGAGEPLLLGNERTRLNPWCVCWKATCLATKTAGARLESRPAPETVSAERAPRAPRSSANAAGAAREYCLLVESLFRCGLYRTAISEGQRQTCPAVNSAAAMLRAHPARDEREHVVGTAVGHADPRAARQIGAALQAGVLDTPEARRSRRRAAVEEPSVGGPRGGQRDALRRRFRTESTPDAAAGARPRRRWTSLLRRPSPVASSRRRPTRMMDLAVSRRCEINQCD